MASSSGIVSIAFGALRPFWPLALVSTLAGGAAGIASAALIAKINGALHQPGGDFTMLLVTFVALAAVAVLGEVVAGIGNSRVGQRIVAAMRLDLADKILTAPIAGIERVKSHRLIAALDRDVNTISAVAFALSSTAIAFAIVLGCFAYLAALSPLLTLFAALVAVIDTAIQAATSRRAVRNFDVARAGYDDLQKQYREIIDGAKELRVNRARRRRARDRHLGDAVATIRDRFVRAMSTYFIGKGVNAAIFFGTLLLVLVIGRRIGVSGEALSGFVLVLLFVRGPIDQIVSTLPMFADASVSLRRINDLSSQLTGSEPYLLDGDAGKAFAGDVIELRHVRYAFPESSFVLGPVDLTIRRGETLFVSGLNGSGKTTLLKLILALYAAEEGQLLCDGEEVTPARRDAYRQLFSVIFADYYLFQTLLEASDPKRIQGYLERLDIAHRVSVEGDAFSTTDLSTGQRKRLALIHLLLEDRPIVVLDEWAADQDPAFRAVFYLELIPELKRMGKTLIVVSHDDRYFAAADRMIHLADGRVTETEGPAKAARVSQNN